MKPLEIIFVSYICVLLSIGIAGRCVEWVILTELEPWVDHPSPFPNTPIY